MFEMGDEAETRSDFYRFFYDYLGMGFYHTRTNRYHYHKLLRHLCFGVAFLL